MPQTIVKPPTGAQLELPLSEYEQSQLRRCERVIEEGLKTFYKVGNALMEIREGKLYRDTYSTFDEYCKSKWGMSKSHAYRMMEATEVVRNLQAAPEQSPNGEGPITPAIEVLPQNEAQARPLSTLPADEQRETWSAVVEESKETGEPITQAAVQAKVDEKHPEKAAERQEKRQAAQPPAETVAVVDKRGAATTAAAPAPAAKAPETKPLPPAQMMTCLLPIDEYDWLCEQGWTPAVAMAKLRELVTDGPRPDEGFVLRFDEAAAETITFVCGSIGEEPVAYIMGIMEKRYKLLKGEE